MSLHDRMSQSIESAAFMFFTKRTIGPDSDPYLVRWILVQTPWFSVYVHKLVRSDYERALHDHPWGFVSLVLVPYAEWWFIPWTDELDPDRRFYRNGRHHSWRRVGWDGGHDGYEIFTRHRPFDILWRPAGRKHRVVIEDGKPSGWTLVFTGPRTRKWGFWPNGIWCHWKSFNQDLGICEAGPIAGRKGLD